MTVSAARLVVPTLRGLCKFAALTRLQLVLQGLCDCHCRLAHKLAHEPVVALPLQSWFVAKSDETGVHVACGCLGTTAGAQALQTQWRDGRTGILAPGGPPVTDTPGSQSAWPAGAAAGASGSAAARAAGTRKGFRRDGCQLGLAQMPHKSASLQYSQQQRRGVWQRQPLRRQRRACRALAEPAASQTLHAGGAASCAMPCCACGHVQYRVALVPALHADMYAYGNVSASVSYSWWAVCRLMSHKDVCGAHCARQTMLALRLEPALSPMFFAH